jgi:hypothetical protein
VFEQDDFYLYYNNITNPGAPGSQFVVTGVLKDWTSNQILYNFTLTGTNTNSPSVIGSNYVTTYDQSTLKINLPFAGAQQWIGTGSVFTEVNTAGLNAAGDPLVRFAASDYSRPAYVTQPETFASVGGGQFTGATGQAIDFATLNIPWLGSYNWGYGPNTNSAENYAYYQHGNTQGELTVPEPMTLLLLGLGLVGVAGIRRKFKS